jgi:predicted dehydrogenase
VPAFGERPWHVIQDSVKNIEAHWLECLKEGGEPSPSGADNLKTLDLVFAAYQSAERAQAVSIATRDGARPG